MSEFEPDVNETEQPETFAIAVETMNKTITFEAVTEWVVNDDQALHVKNEEKFLGSFAPGQWECVYRVHAVKNS